jgi:hypothetical protein
MCNYFSIGVESRIGLGFDKKRTESVCCNKCCYAWEGLKKICRCFAKTKKIKDVVEYVAKLDREGNEHIIFATDPKIKSERYISKN